MPWDVGGEDGGERRARDGEGLDGVRKGMVFKMVYMATLGEEGSDAMQFIDRV